MTIAILLLLRGNKSLVVRLLNVMDGPFINPYYTFIHLLILY
jgi:hypothetical protein